MSEPKWTKEPWRLAYDAQGPCMIIHPSRDGVAIASLTSTFKPTNGFHDDWMVFHSDGNLDTATTNERIAERNANAHLIFAAPDLYEAAALLEQAEDAHANCPECEGEGIPELCERCFPLFDDARLKRRAALAKASGGTP